MRASCWQLWSVMEKNCSKIQRLFMGSVTRDCVFMFFEFPPFFYCFPFRRLSVWPKITETLVLVPLTSKVAGVSITLSSLRRCPWIVHTECDWQYRLLNSSSFGVERRETNGNNVTQSGSLRVFCAFPCPLSLGSNSVRDKRDATALPLSRPGPTEAVLGTISRSDTFAFAFAFDALRPFSWKCVRTNKALGFAIQRKCDRNIPMKICPDWR
jgi:hypothetical protein